MISQTLSNSARLRKQILVHLDQLAEQAVEARISEELERYLAFQARFHSYSSNNVLLIMAQDPAATLVNSYKRWKELGRQVQRGEKGIQVFFPMFRTVEKLDAKTLQPVEDRELTGFGIGSVFDVRQTAGKPLATRPEIPFAERWEETPESIDLNKRAAAWGRRLPPGSP